MLKKLYIFILLFLPLLVAQEEISGSSDDSITRVVITPRTVIISPGETAKFTFQAFTSNNEEVPAAFSWRFGGGKLLHDGRFIAGDRAGEYGLEAVSPNGIKAVAKIIIKDTYATDTDNKAYTVKIVPKEIRLKHGESCKFTFAAYNKRGRKVPVPMEISYGGGTLDNKGNFVAGNKEGKYKFMVSTKDGLSAEAKVFIGNIATSERPVVYIKIVPQKANLYPGEKTKFTFAAYDKFGEIVDCDLSLASGGGKVDSSGLYVAGNVPGRYEFKVTAQNGISGSAKIRIAGEQNSGSDVGVVAKQQPRSQEIRFFSIAPRFVKLSPGEKQTFSFEATNKNGQKIVPQINIQFSGGKFSSDGTYIAGNRSGMYKITATTSQGQKAEANIHIIGGEKVASQPKQRPGGLHKVVLLPRRKRIRPREQIQFQFKALDKDGNRTPTSLSWSYQGGRLTAEGLYTAGYGYGQHHVTLTGDKGIQATSLIAIVPHNDEYIPPVWIELLPRQAKIRAGQSQRFTCRVFNDQGQPLSTSKIKWEFYGGMWDPNTMTFIAGNKTGDFYLRARYENSEYVVARCHIEIK